MQVAFHYGDYSIVSKNDDKLAVVYNSKKLQHTFKNSIEQVLDTEMMLDDGLSVTIPVEVVGWIQTVYDNYNFCFNS